jgi:Na+-transporting NADH:ubiquinone oxidoreductase subunit NqrB
MRLPKDPRWLQIGFLSSFLLLGLCVFDFELAWWTPAVILASTCATQWACIKLWKLAPQGYLSPIITGLGLSLLLRADAWWVPPLFASAAIASKFVFRREGRHLFNPTTFGLALAMLTTRHAWCSPSQWGESSAFLAWVAVLGCAVVHKSFRSDISLAFLGAWVLLKLARVLYLGQSMRVLGHQLAFGSLILFAFFMISDPKTTPSHRAGRIAIAVLIAGGGYYLQHALYWNNALIWALMMSAPLTALIDRLLPAARFEWPGTAAAVPVPIRASAV